MIVVVQIQYNTLFTFEHILQLDILEILAS